MKKDIYKEIYETAKGKLVLVENEDDKDFIAKNLVNLYKYTDGKIDLNSIYETFSSFVGFFETPETMKSSENLNCTACHSFGCNQSTGEIIRNGIYYIDTIDKNYLDHVLTHENIHLFSSRVTKDFFNNFYPTSGIHTYFPFIDEVMTEFVANRIEEMNGTLEDNNLKTTVKDSEGSFRIISESSSYREISGFGYIFDSLLHDEIIKSKYSNSDSLYAYKTLLFDVERDFAKCMNHCGRNSYVDLNKSIENLCVGVIIDKYHSENLNKQELLEFYIPLRISLQNYGNIDFQKDMVKRLDNLIVNDLILDKKISKSKISKILDTMTSEENISLDYFDDNLKSTGHKNFIVSKELSKIDSFDEVFIQSKEDISKAIVHSCKDFNELERLYSVAAETSLGLINSDNMFWLYNELHFSYHEDIKGRNLSYVLARQKDTDSSVLTRFFDNFKKDKELLDVFTKKDKFGKNSFEYALIDGNTQFCASYMFILASRNIENEGILNEFFKREESFLKEHPEQFFDAVYYSSLYGNSERAKFFNETLSCLKDINFKDIKTDYGRNFFSYITYNDYNVDKIGFDKLIFYKNYEKDVLEDIKIALCNDFSFSDMGSYNNTFDKFVENVSFRDDSQHLRLFKSVVEILENDNSLEEAIDGVSIITAFRATKLGFNFDTVLNGATIYQNVLEHHWGVSMFKEFLDVSDERYRDYPKIMNDAFDFDSEEVWKFGFAEFTKINHIPENEKAEILFDTAKRSLKEGKGNIFRAILVDFPEVVIDKNFQLLEEYSKMAIKCNSEISHCEYITVKETLNTINEENSFDENSNFSKLLKLVNEENHTVNLNNVSFSEISRQNQSSLEV